MQVFGACMFQYGALKVSNIKGGNLLFFDASTVFFLVMYCT